MRTNGMRTAAAAMAVALAATTSLAEPGSARAAAPAPVPVTSTAVAPNADGRMTMFAADRGHTVWIRTQVAADTWSGWSLFATALTTLVAQANGNGLIEVFGADDAGRLWHRWQSAPNSESWSMWELFGTALSDAPSALSVAADANGGLTLFALDPEGQTWGRTQYIGATGTYGGGSWSPWRRLDGTTSTIAAQTNGNGLIQLFGANTAGRLQHRWELAHNTGSWSPWEDFHGSWLSTPSSITATTTGPGGAVVVFVTTSYTLIWGRTAYIGPNGGNGGGTWTPWVNMDGRLTGITAIGYPDRRVELFGVDGAGQLFRRKELTPGVGSWTPWEPVNRPMA
jgi:hypothetical protein